MTSIPGYLSMQAHPGAGQFVPSRRGLTQSLPDLPNDACISIADAIFEKYGLDDYVGCSTVEMTKRPVPHVFEEKETKDLTDVYASWAHDIYSRIFAELKPVVQTFNKVSRLGWSPTTGASFRNPENKMDYLRQDFALFEREGVTPWKGSFIIMNVRLQVESKKKSREFLAVRDDGSVFKFKTDENERRVKVGQRGYEYRIGSKTRLVFNLPTINLYKQTLDSAIHKVLLNYRTFSHDMYNKNVLPVNGFHMCFDVKHFERHTASICRLRGEIFGGAYAEVTHLFADIPFLVPSETWDSFHYLKVDRESGYSDQYASGDSAVAPAQKEIFIALYAQFFVERLGMSRTDALNAVFDGGTSDFTIRNYGDDNSVSGKEDLVRDCLKFLKQYLTVEEEVPPKFLGFVWYPEFKDWMLPPTSYLLNTHCPERRPYSNFRTYPNMGWVEKRKIYAKLGHPSISTEIFPFEDELLRKHGLPWSHVVERSIQERVRASGTPGQLSANFILGKDYNMSNEEKLKSGLFFGLPADKTAAMIKLLLGEEWARRMPW